MLVICGMDRTEKNFHFKRPMEMIGLGYVHQTHLPFVPPHSALVSELCNLLKRFFLPL